MLPNGFHPTDVDEIFPVVGLSRDTLASHFTSISFSGVSTSRLL